MADLEKLNLHISVWDKEKGRPDVYIGNLRTPIINVLDTSLALSEIKINSIAPILPPSILKLPLH